MRTTCEMRDRSLLDDRVPPCLMPPLVMQPEAYPRVARNTPLQGLQRVCWCTTMSQRVQLRREQGTGMGVCSPRPGHCEFCKQLPDSLTGCVGLAANGAGWQTTSELPKCDLRRQASWPPTRRSSGRPPKEGVTQQLPWET